MKKTIILALAFVFTMGGAIAQDWSETELQDMFMEYMEDNGYDDAFIDSDGDVQFTYNDHDYFIETNEDNNQFFRVVLWNFWPIESQTESVQAAFACNEVNKERLVAKAYITNDDQVWIACEAFFDSPDMFKPVFERMMEQIELGIDTFVGEM